jgi:hypothetical protein
MSITDQFDRLRERARTRKSVAARLAQLEQEAWLQAEQLAPPQVIANNREAWKREVQLQAMQAFLAEQEERIEALEARLRAVEQKVQP